MAVAVVVRVLVAIVVVVVVVVVVAVVKLVIRLAELAGERRRCGHLELIVTRNACLQKAQVLQHSGRGRRSGILQGLARGAQLRICGRLQGCTISDACCHFAIAGEGFQATAPASLKHSGITTPGLEDLKR